MLLDLLEHWTHFPPLHLYLHLYFGLKGYPDDSPRNEISEAELMNLVSRMTL